MGPRHTELARSSWQDIKNTQALSFLGYIQETALPEVASLADVQSKGGDKAIEAGEPRRFSRPPGWGENWEYHSRQPECSQTRQSQPRNPVAADTVNAL